MIRAKVRRHVVHDPMEGWWEGEMSQALRALLLTNEYPPHIYGGISKVVVDGETGYLVDPDLSSEPLYAPRDAALFATRLAEALNHLLADPARRRRMGQQGRARVEQHYSWGAVAQQTLALYRRLQRV